MPFLEKLVVGDVKGITNGFGSLSVFTNEKGGIIDDTVITKVISENWQHPQITCVTWPSCFINPVVARVIPEGLTGPACTALA